MKDLATNSELQDQQDVDLLRALAATHLSHGGVAAANDLLELARMIKPDDGPTLILLARVWAQMGDLVKAALLIAEAKSLNDGLSDADQTFAHSLRDRLEQQVGLISA